MKPKRIQSWILPMAVMLSTLSTASVLAQTDPEGHYRAGAQIIMNLNACKKIPCELNFSYANVKVLSGFIGSDGNLYHAENKPLHIVTNLPAESVETNNVLFRSGHHDSVYSNSGIEVLKGPARKVTVGTCIYSDRKVWSTLGQRSDYIFEIAFEYKKTGCYRTTSVAVSRLALNVGTAVDIVENMKQSSVPMIAAYQGIAEHLTDFKQIVAKDSSDARHLSRLESHLKAQLKMMVDDQGKPLLPITHRRVTEGSRMIMVLSTVLEEIMDRYDFNSRFLEPLKPAKDSLSQLSKQLRITYGWEDGLAGSGSKALLALSAILDSELRSMLSILSATNDPTIMTSFNAIMRANEQMGLRVKASNAGDIAGSELARALLRQWNSPGWQQILSAMMSAPQVTQAQLQNRILVALTAIESIKDYVDPKGDSNLNVDLPANVRARVPTEGRAVLP